MISSKAPTHRPIAAPSNHSAHRVRWCRTEFIRYFGTSLIALATDALALAFLVEQANWTPLPAAAVSFMLGSAVAFALSSQWVFTRRRYQRWYHGLFLFTVIGLLGLLVNLGVIAVATLALSIPYMAAKALAAGFSFIVNFVIRKLALFTPHQASTASIGSDEHFLVAPLPKTIE